MKFQERATKLGWGFILQACSSDCQFLFLKFAHVEKEEASIFYLLHCIVIVKDLLSQTFMRIILVLLRTLSI